MWAVSCAVSDCLIWSRSQYFYVARLRSRNTAYHMMTTLKFYRQLINWSVFLGWVFAIGDLTLMHELWRKLCIFPVTLPPGIHHITSNIDKIPVIFDWISLRRQPSVSPPGEQNIGFQLQSFLRQNEKFNFRCFNVFSPFQCPGPCSVLTIRTFLTVFISRCTGPIHLSCLFQSVSFTIG